jgi:hypothetical protein
MRQPLSSIPTRITVALTFTLALIGGTSFAGTGHDHSPKYGGIVYEGKELDLELVAKPDVISLYLRDHGKPMSAKGATAKVTLLTGAEKSEVALQPTEDGSRLEAKGTFKVTKGTRAVATVMRAEKPALTARFVVK